MMQSSPTVPGSEGLGILFIRVSFGRAQTARGQMDAQWESCEMWCLGRYC